MGLSGFTADTVGTLTDARAALEGGGFAGMVLDIMLPDGSGLDLLAELRSRGSRIPVLLLTARDQVRDRVFGLDAGADDYLASLLIWRNSPRHPAPSPPRNGGNSASLAINAIKPR